MRYTNDDLGEALGQKYVALNFGAEAKERTLNGAPDTARPLVPADRSPTLQEGGGSPTTND